MSSLTTRWKKALILGLDYPNMGLWTLKGAWNDTKAARDLLRGTYGFADDEIVFMFDRENANESLLPTKGNIMRELGNFVKEGNVNTDYVFIYAGHTDQFPHRPAMYQEEDGMAECIVALDAITSDAKFPDEDKCVFDYELHDYMIKRLGPGSQLTAIADSCHSATILNLPHYRCNRPDGARSIIRRLLCNTLEVTVTKLPRLEEGSQPPGHEASDSSRYVVRKHRKRDPSQTGFQGFCTGLCYGSPIEAGSSLTPSVICISSCKDGESTYENAKGESMLHCIVKYLSGKPAPTLGEVMKHVQGYAQETYNALREHQKLLPRGEDNTKAKPWQPQLSSSRPLDLKSKLTLCQTPTCPTGHAFKRRLSA